MVCSARRRHPRRQFRRLAHRDFTIVASRHWPDSQSSRRVRACRSQGSDFEDSTVFCRVICQGSCSARNIYWQAFFYIGGFDEHRVSLQWLAQKDRISIFRAAVGVCSGGAMSGDFSLADVIVTTAPSDPESFRRFSSAFGNLCEGKQAGPAGAD